MDLVDFHFPAFGELLQRDHGYGLYSALSQRVPALHAADCPIRVGPILGEHAGKGLLRLVPNRSRLRLRLPVSSIGLTLPFVGTTLQVEGYSLRLGVPQVIPLSPAPALVARLVTIKGFTEPAAFLAAAQRQLDALGVGGEIGIPPIQQGDHKGKPARRVLDIKGRRVVGFGLQVAGLTAEESIRLQEHGLGGRAKMGGGFFVALRPRT
jgi:CRISPR-associated protein Cas6